MDCHQSTVFTWDQYRNTIKVCITSICITVEQCIRLEIRKVLWSMWECRCSINQFIKVAASAVSSWKQLFLSILKSFSLIIRFKAFYSPIFMHWAIINRAPASFFTSAVVQKYPFGFSWYLQQNTTASEIISVSLQ